MNAVVINFFKTAMNPTTKLVTDMVKCAHFFRYFMGTVNPILQYAGMLC
jgi:hypothetical protein